jgi:hypothetical protein
LKLVASFVSAPLVVVEGKAEEEEEEEVGVEAEGEGTGVDTCEIGVTKKETKGTGKSLPKQDEVFFTGVVFCPPPDFLRRGGGGGLTPEGKTKAGRSALFEKCVKRLFEERRGFWVPFHVSDFQAHRLLL